VRKWTELTAILKITKAEVHPITGHKGPDVE
jgi:hypothetical protein